MNNLIINEYCLVNKIQRFRKIINDNYEKINGIRIARMVDYVSSDKSYATTYQKGYYEVVKDITDNASIKEIINALKRSNYPYTTNLPGYSYLFQVFVDDKEILEFDYGSIYTEDDSLMIIFTDKDKNILNNYINY